MAAEITFKEARRKFQGKYFKWKRRDNPFTYYYFIKKIMDSELNYLFVINDFVCSDNKGYFHESINNCNRCKYKDMSFVSTFGKRIPKSEYKKVFRLACRKKNLNR